MTTALEKPKVEDLNNNARALAQRGELAVVDERSQGDATQLLGDVTAALKDVETRRKQLVDPLNKHVRFINDLFKSVTAPLEKLDQVLRAKLLAYRNKVAVEAEAKRREAEETRRKAEEEQRQAAAEKARLDAAAAVRSLDAEFGDAMAVKDAGAAAAAAKQAGATLQAAAETIRQASVAIVTNAPPPAVTRAGDARTTVRKRWTFEITDPEKVPDLYWELDLTAIRKAVGAGARDIPGVRIFQAEELAVG